MASQQMIDKYGKVAVLLGGFSAERSISLKTGQAVLSALLAAGVDAYPVDPKEDGLETIAGSGYQRAWNALHGRGGEDGVMQSFLQLQQIPYTGCGVMASALSMDKLRTKLVWQAMQIPVAKHKMVGCAEMSIEQAEQILAELNGCAMVKPIREGSSVGMAKVSNTMDLIEAVKKASQYDSQVMLEQWIDGLEYTVTIVNEEALPSIHMHTPNDFYDFEAKYQSNSTEYHCPSGLSESDEQHIQQLALKAFKAIDGHGWARIDFLRDKHNKQWYLLEANTIPGMTETSLVPKSAEVAGMSFTELTLAILDTSFVERK